MSSDLMELLAVIAQLPPGSSVTKPALVKESVFVTIVWAGTAISFLFVSGRIIVRLRTSGRLWFDDLFVVIGWLLILGSSIVWRYAERAMYLSIEVAAGQLSPLEYTTYIPDTEHYMKSTVAIIILFYSSLAAIKISFLLFFRRLLSGVHIRVLMIQWWVVFGITIVTWIACIADTQYKCLAAPYIKIVQECTKQWSVNFQRITLTANCVMDVVTDALIITIPVAILWNTRIPMKHRLALAGLFGLTIVTMTFAIVRVAVVLSATEQADVSWLYMWSAIEPPIAVIISCLISFRALFGSAAVRTRPTGSYTRTGNSSFMSNPWRRLINRTKDGSIALKDISNGDTHHSGKIRPEGYRTASSEQILDRQESQLSHVAKYHA
ncbi:uncharacterized protein BP5553_02746 [Venustampulla echinocandica]|uniref:Rhodopsin domain-containing protein n=1 Tax=Venustampulla echinocandica TaxID=2656787 RepID=A0A370TS95_9HELO|nr:uncharacterized protein BP5553_02746 [Venustampulla echinocandica]RDL38406.1 hypothetical protein BP5553_02746 [Venustampulla echinocandica]